MVVLSIILALAVLLRIDKVVLAPGSTDVYLSVPYTFDDYLLFASLGITVTVVLVTLLAILFQSFLHLLYALVASLTTAFLKIFNVGRRVQRGTPGSATEDDRDASRSGEARA